MKYAIISLVLLIVLGLIVGLLALNRQRTVWKPGGPKLASLDSVPQAAWDKLATKKLLFAHMSVGADILAGVDEVLRERPNIRLQIREWDGRSPMTEPGLWHAKLGSNGNAPAKIGRFAEMMAGATNPAPDIALMKLCYVDVRSTTDTEAIWGTYRKVLGGLEAAHPKTAFLHMTVPIQSRSIGAKQRLRQGLAGLLGKADSIDDNVRRETFNRAVRQVYGSGHSLFDIALLQASGTEGICQSERGVGATPMMGAAYTSDGGHLNTAGRRRIAGQLLVWLARSSDSARGH